MSLIRAVTKEENYLKVLTKAQVLKTCYVYGFMIFDILYFWKFPNLTLTAELRALIPATHFNNQSLRLYARIKRAVVPGIQYSPEI